MFKDRKDAGIKLAAALSDFRNRKNVIVLGIPRGGMEVAYYVAEYLHCDLSLVVTRKLGHPSNPEAAFGAVAEDGSLFVFPYAVEIISKTARDEILKREQDEIQRRIKSLRHGRNLPSLKGKTVILVDDGIATGATIFAAIQFCKNKQAGKIVVAAPISGQSMKSELMRLVDQVVILYTPEDYYAVGQGYENFTNLSDEETLQILDKWETAQLKII